MTAPASFGAAFELAFHSHLGQTDKAGEPYIAHVVRVTSGVSDETARIAALLHDVVEDTGVSLDDVGRQFGTEVRDAVDAVTRRKGEEVTAYYARVAANPLALAVKYADVGDNSNPERLARLPEELSARLQKKYAFARSHLAELTGGRTDE